MTTKSKELAHGPLFQQKTLDGEVAVECSCGHRTAPHGDLDAAYAELSRHIFPGGE